MWQRPSDAVRELIRRGAEMALDGSVPWLEEMQEVPLASRYAQSVADDPVIVSAIRRSTRESCLRWVAENISHPGEPVPANVTEEELVAVRSVVSRGLDEAAVIDAYRLAQNAAMRYWMPLAFRLTSDPDDLRELLDVCQRSIASFIEAVVTQLCHMILIEQAQQAPGTDPVVQKIVTQVVDGGLPPAKSEERLGYTFRQHHTAAVLWNDQSDANEADLDRVARAFVDTAEGRPALLVRPDAATRWAWLPARESPDFSGLAAVLEQSPRTRIAVGSSCCGVDGFRRSHLDALTVQRLVAHRGSPGQLVSFSDIELVALLGSDPDQTARFIDRTLGKLASADSELQKTVLTFLRERHSASRTAARLFIHRNTLHGRLAQADELLPQPLCTNHIHVAVALEILSWTQ